MSRLEIFIGKGEGKTDLKGRWLVRGGVFYSFKYLMWAAALYEEIPVSHFGQAEIKMCLYLHSYLP